MEVGLHSLDRLVVEAVLVELDECLEEVALGHHRLGALPAHVLAALEQHHAHAHLRHHLCRLGEGLELRDVLLAQVGQRVCRLGQRRQRLLERRLRLLLLLGDPGRINLELALRGDRLGGALLGHRGLLGNVLEHRLDVHGLGLDLLLGDLQLDGHRVHLGGGLHQLTQPTVEARDHVVDLLALVAQHAAVVGDEVEVVLGRHVVVPLELQLEGLALRHDALVHEHHVRHDVLPVVVGQVLLGEEDPRHAHQRLLGPRHEPVDDRVVDHTGEGAAAHAQRLADG